MNERNIATEMGEPRYSTGRPCRRGHFSERYTSTGMCIQCLKEAATTRAECRRKADSRRNTDRMNGLTPVQVWVPAQDHVTIKRCANLFRTKPPEVQEQLRAFLTIMEVNQND